MSRDAFINSPYKLCTSDLKVSIGNPAFEKFYTRSTRAKKTTVTENWENREAALSMMNAIAHQKVAIKVVILGEEGGRCKPNSPNNI